MPCTPNLHLDHITYDQLMHLLPLLTQKHIGATIVANKQACFFVHCHPLSRTKKPAFKRRLSSHYATPSFSASTTGARTSRNRLFARLSAIETVAGATPSSQPTSTNVTPCPPNPYRNCTTSRSRSVKTVSTA